MIIKIYPFIIFLLSTLFFYDCSKSQSNTPKKEDPFHPLLQAFEDSLKLNIKRSEIPGAAVAIVKDTSIIYLKGFGLRETGTNDSINIHSVFRIASLSKGFTSVLTGILVENGILKWHDKVVKYFNNFALKDPLQTDRVEISHLLSHTSGLPRHAYTNLIEDGIPLKKVIKQLKNVNLISREGEIYAYQNAAFAVIEQVLKGATDIPFNELIRQRIFLPAGMKDATVSYDDLYNNLNLARPHKWSVQKESYVPIKLSKKYFNAVSAGGISASIADMAQWLLLLTGNRPKIISDSLLTYIFKPVINTNTRRYSRRWGSKKSSYALGWRVLKFQNRDIVYHGGYVNAYRSEIAIDRQNKTALCILFNAPYNRAGNIIPDFFRSLEKTRISSQMVKSK